MCFPFISFPWILYGPRVPVSLQLNPFVRPRSGSVGFFSLYCVLQCFLNFERLCFPLVRTCPESPRITCQPSLPSGRSTLRHRQDEVSCSQVAFFVSLQIKLRQLPRGTSGNKMFGARTHGFCTHQARPTCKNTGKLNNRSRETGTLRRYCRRIGCPLTCIPIVCIRIG